MSDLSTTLYVALLSNRHAPAEHDGQKGAGVVEYLGLAALGVAIVAILLTGMTDVTNTLMGNIRDMVTGG